jgi:hypothetical protein
MMVARVAKGVSAHFVSRLHEWTFACVMAVMGYLLLLPNVTFDQPVFRAMALVATETEWGAFLATVGGVRLVALVVNGTFPQFHTITPVIRSIMAFASAFVWFCLAWGFHAASPHGITFVAWVGLMCKDIALSWVIAREAGAADQRYRNGCGRQGVILQASGVRRSRFYLRPSAS